MRTIRSSAALAALLLAAPLGLAAQRNLDTVQIRAVRVASGVHMLVGAGGNIGVSTGADGTFLIDDQFAPLTPRITAAVAAISPGPIRFVLNTHWHGDHTGGNENLGRGGTVIVAHDNVRRRMSTEQFMQAIGQRVPASPAGALPVVTFDRTVTFHLNGDSLRAIHIPSAHTDGDAIVHFVRANVVHTGDLFFNGAYPFIDLSSGGSLQGVIAGVDRVLAMTNASTRIIPGHGPLATPADLRSYRTMLVTVQARVGAAIRAGRTLQQVLAARPSREYDDAMGRGFINPTQFVTAVYTSMQPRSAPRPRR